MFGSGSVEIVERDLSLMQVDAIVNAANKELVAGGGVDGAIHRAAGPELQRACNLLRGCPTGAARLTPGYNLRARFVIHTVGPVWRGGQQGEERLLASCYRTSLELAGEQGFKTVAFPAISTGVYRFPLDRAAQIALSEVKTYLESHTLPEKIFLVCFGTESFRTFQTAAAGILV